MYRRRTAEKLAAFSTLGLVPRSSGALINFAPAVLLVLPVVRMTFIHGEDNPLTFKL